MSESISTALLVLLGSLVTGDLVYNYTTDKYKRAHCQYIETRVEYDKCFKEFGEKE